MSKTLILLFCLLGLALSLRIEHKYLKDHHDRRQPGFGVIYDQMHKYIKDHHSEEEEVSEEEAAAEERQKKFIEQRADLKETLESGEQFSDEQLLQFLQWMVFDEFYGPEIVKTLKQYSSHLKHEGKGKQNHMYCFPFICPL